jgi:hypothetical protein
MTLATETASDIDAFLDTNDFAVAATLCKAQGIQSLTITAGGTGYSAGTLSATGGGGSGFTGTYTVSGGVISSVTITAAGTKFTTVPTIVISSAGNGNATITAGLTTSAINVIFTDAFKAVNPATGEVETSAPQAEGKTSDLAGVAHGDALTINSIAYKVIGIQPSEDGLMTTLILSRD